MSSDGITLSQISAGRVKKGIVLRLLRHWCARNVKRGGQVMGIDLQFVDRESILAHATVNISNMSAFQPLLRDGAVYLVSNFDAGRSSPRYRLSDFHLTLRLSDSASFTEIPEPVPNIPKQAFRFRTHEQLEALAVSNTDLPDIMGQVCSTKAFHDGVTNDLKRMLLILTLQSGQEVRLTAFDNQATDLAKLLKDKQSDFCVLLATNINPRKFAGQLYVNATAGTRFFFNDEVQATQDCMESFRNSNTLVKYRNVQKIEHLSIAELNTFILTSKTQDIDFLCTGKIIDIQSRRGWSFLACSVCGKKMKIEGSSLSCNICTDQPTVGDVRYRVEMVVEDESDKAVFVVFDGEMEKLTNIEASSLTSQMADNGHHDNDDETIPEIITKLIGNTFTFQLRLKEFNYGPYHESFGVSRIIKDAKDIPKPNFLAEGPPESSSSKTDDIESMENLGIDNALATCMKNKKQRLA